MEIKGTINFLKRQLIDKNLVLYKQAHYLLTITSTKPYISQIAFLELYEGTLRFMQHEYLETSNFITLTTSRERPEKKYIHNW